MQRKFIQLFITNNFLIVCHQTYHKLVGPTSALQVSPPPHCAPPPRQFYKFKRFGVLSFLATLISCLIWQRCTESLYLPCMCQTLSLSFSLSVSFSFFLFVSVFFFLTLSFFLFLSLSFSFLLFLSLSFSFFLFLSL